MCVLCNADANYFHTAACAYKLLAKEYPFLWLRDSTRIGAFYLCRELLSPEGIVLAMQNALPMKGWRLRMRYNETADEALNPLSEEVVELSSRSEALQIFMTFLDDAASA